MGSKTLVVSLALASVLYGYPQQVTACGESLYRVGRGVVFRSYSAPIPANVLVYTRSDSEKEFAHRLA